MSQTRKIRIGVIGAGSFARVCHLPGLQSHASAEVVALCSRRIEQARTVAAEFGIARVYDDYRELCEQKDLDAITIATPNDAHFEQALTALGYGKHIFCEKPLGMNVTEAQAMFEKARASGCVHQVAFTFRYNFGVRELRRRIRAGDIGQPYFARVQYDNWEGLTPGWKVGWREKLEIAGGGMLFDLGSHVLDIVRFALGPIETAGGFTFHIPRRSVDTRSGESTAVETDDIAAACFQHRNGARGQFFISRITPSFTANGNLEAIGPEGALKATLSRGKFDRLQFSCPSEPAWADVSLPEAAYDQQPHALGAMMRSFVDACLRGSIDPELDASFEDGLAAQLAIAAVLEGQRTGGQIRLAALSHP